MFKRREDKCNLIGITFLILVTILEFITFVCILPALANYTYGLIALTLLSFNGSICFFSRKCGRAMEDFHLERKNYAKTHNTQE